MADQKLPKEKWKPEFVSPGEAFMNHAEKHHNAGTVTPSYLKEKGQAVQQIQKVVEQYKKDLQQPPGEKEFQKNVREHNEHREKLAKNKDDKELKVSR